MKTAKLRNVPATILLVVGLAGASSAQAINETLGNSEDDLDLYVLNCPAGTTHAEVRIREDSSPSDTDRVKLEIEFTGNTNNCGDSPSDANNNPDAYFNQTADNDGSWVNNNNSGYVQLHCAAGRYDAVVYHTRAVAEDYTTTIRCRGDAVVNAPTPPNPDE